MYTLVCSQDLLEILKNGYFFIFLFLFIFIILQLNLFNFQNSIKHDNNGIFLSKNVKYT